MDGKLTEKQKQIIKQVRQAAEDYVIASDTFHYNERPALWLVAYNAYASVMKMFAAYLDFNDIDYPANVPLEELYLKLKSQDDFEFKLMNTGILESFANLKNNEKAKRKVGREESLEALLMAEEVITMMKKYFEKRGVEVPAV